MYVFCYQVLILGSKCNGNASIDKQLPFSVAKVATGQLPSNASQLN